MRVLPLLVLVACANRPGNTDDHARLSARALDIDHASRLELTWLTQDQLVATLRDVQTECGLDARAPVDVVVDDSVTVQGLVDVLVELDQANVTMIGLSKS